MAASVKLLIQNGRETVEMQARSDELIFGIKTRLEGLSGVLARQQKLIHKGKVLLSGATVQECKLKDGAKIMLMASSGGGSTQAHLALALPPIHILFSSASSATTSGLLWGRSLYNMVLFVS